MIGTFRIGEDLVIALDAYRGDVADVIAIEAKIVEVYRENGPIKGTPIALEVTDRAAEGDNPAGWLCSLDAATTATLVPGVYAIDARLQLADAVEITAEPVHVTFTRSLFV